MLGVTDGCSTGHARGWSPVMAETPTRRFAAARAAGYHTTVRAVAVVNGNARRVRGSLRAKLKRVLLDEVRFAMSLAQAGGDP
jgi:hypothetical protein